MDQRSSLNLSSGPITNTVRGCTSKSRVQVTLCAAGRLSVMEMRRSTDFQIQEVLRLASAAVFWSLCFYEDNHLTGQWPDMVHYLLKMVQKKNKKNWNTKLEATKGQEKVSSRCHVTPPGQEDDCGG